MADELEFEGSGNGVKFELNEKVIVRDEGIGRHDYTDTIVEITKGGNYKTSKGTIYNSDGHLRGRTGYSSPYIVKCTPKALDELLREKYIRMLPRYEWEGLSLDQLKKIVEMINSFENK